MSVFRLLLFVVILLNVDILVNTWRQMPIFWLLLSLSRLAADIFFTTEARLPINQLFGTRNAAPRTRSMKPPAPVATQA